MDGTPKQAAWASAIKTAELGWLANDRVYRLAQGLGVTPVDDAIAHLSSIESAAWWIDNRDNDIAANASRVFMLRAAGKLAEEIRYNRKLRAITPVEWR